MTSIDPEGRSFFRHTVSIAGGTVLGQGVLILSLPVLSRLYTPEDFGVFGVFSAFIAVATVVVCLRLDLAIASSQSDDDADRLLALSLAALPGVLLVTAAAFLLARSRGWMSLGAMPEWSVLAVMLVLGVTAVFSLLRFWNIRHLGFDLVARALVHQGLGRAGASAAAGLAHPGWIGLAFGELIGRSFGIVRLAKPAIPRLALLSHRPRESRAVLRRYWKFPVIALPSSLIDAAAGAIPVMLIAESFSTTLAGHFAMVARIAGLPAAFVAASVADVFHSYFRRANTSDATGARARVARLALRLLVIGIAIYVPAGLLAPTVLPVVLGDPWFEAAVQLRILAPFFVVTLVVSPLSRALAVLNRLEIKLVVDVLLLVVPLCTLGFFHLADPHSSLMLYVWSNVAVYGIYFGLIWYAAGRNARVTLPAC